MFAEWKNKLKALEKDLNSNKPTDPKRLYEAIEVLHSHQRSDQEWGEASLAHFKTMCRMQCHLIKRVIKAQEAEEKMELVEFFEGELRIDKADFETNDGRRGHRMQLHMLREDECYIVGDLHGDATALKKMLDRTGFYKNSGDESRKMKWIFMGDYIDRGRRQIEVLERLLVLKLLFPHRIFLQRGNHELGNIERGAVKLGIKKPAAEPDTDYLLLHVDEWRKHYGNSAKGLLVAYVGFFSTLTICSFLKSKEGIFMLNHGGIVRPKEGNVSTDPSAFYSHVKSLASLADASIEDEMGNTAEHNLLWSDPWEESIAIKDETRRFRFDRGHYHLFRDLFGFETMIRGHQAFDEGVKTFFDALVISVFSSGQAEDQSNPDTAYPWISPKIICIAKADIKAISIFDASDGGVTLKGHSKRQEENA